ncbi:transmembrane protein 87A [Cherax quadricarinatus]
MLKPVILILFLAVFACGFPEQGIWHLTTRPGLEYVGVKKSLFKGSRINIKVMCHLMDQSKPLDISISWMLRKTPCWNEYIFSESTENDFFQSYYKDPDIAPKTSNGSKYEVGYVKTIPEQFPCDQTIVLSEVDIENGMIMKADSEALKAQLNKEMNAEEEKSTPVTTVDSTILSKSKISPEGSPRTKNPVAVVPYDGVYLLVVHTTAQSNPAENLSYVAYIDIEMQSDYGYLSAVDWPLLGFYAAMCVVYLVYGIAWLIMSAIRWQELLRVQYWIGAVIFLGMLEKAVFTAEYRSLNTQGCSVSGLIIFAELVSCAKRTLARMLVIIVSLGFGIVKPRLGVVLHRVVGVGLLYFVLASIEGCTRALQVRIDPQRQVLLASLPLSLLESAICFWIFTALVQTTRTLRLRRNLVKLSLYRHFTNTLAFAVIASIIFMLWSIRYHQFETCLTDWKELWVDDAYWHVLFAIVLLVIMVLWRPSNNNQVCFLY